MTASVSVIRRKHRLIVEVTFNQAVRDNEAVSALSLLLDQLDLDAKPIYADARNLYVDKLTVKSLRRWLSARKGHDMASLVFDLLS